jgi:hypothetical protein
MNFPEWFIRSLDYGLESMNLQMNERLTRERRASGAK